MNRTISIDWLQINALGIITLSPYYTYKIMGYKTRIFGKIIEVYKGKDIFCTIASEPLSPILNKLTNLIKLDNKQLYKMDFIKDFQIFIKRHKLIVKGITRLDLCSDFNLFDCNMLPNTFINNYFALKYKQLFKSGFNTYGKQKEINYFDYLRFGKNSSVVTSYLYNKSKEMNDVKFKQHIFDNWVANDLNILKDVWRLEFSIKTSRLSIVDEHTGELYKLNLTNLANHKYLNLLFVTMLDNYFSFAYRNTYVDKNKNTRVELFNYKKSIYSAYIESEKLDYNRGDKVFLKKLESYNNELRAVKSDLTDSLTEIKERFIDTRRLRKFYNSKIREL